MSHDIGTAVTVDRMFLARCTCGWSAIAGSATMRDWKVDTHLQDSHRVDLPRELLEAVGAMLIGALVAVAIIGSVIYAAGAWH